MSDSELSETSETLEPLEPHANDKIWDNITFSGRGPQYESRLQDFSDYKDMYVFNEYSFFLALKDYIARTGNGLSAEQIEHIVNSFGNAGTGTFLRELYEIYNNKFDKENPAPPDFLNSMSELLITLCDNIQQDGMHDFYELGRVLVANFKILVKTYINHGTERKFVHLKEEHFDKLGLPKLEKFTLDDHDGGKFFIDTLSKQHKKLFESVYQVPAQKRKRPDWLYSSDPNENHITTSVAATLDGTGSTKKTERCLQCDNVPGTGMGTKAGAIELGIYSIGAMALGSMFDLVCYKGNADADYKYMFYPFFKFDGNDNKSVLFRTKSVLMVLVRYDHQSRTTESEDILVDNRTFTVANISKDIYKVYKTIDKETTKPNNDLSDVWFSQLKTDNLFMGILKLCVPNLIREKIKDALEDPSNNRPTWGDVRDYIVNARNLYTKFKIFGKGLGDFDQAYEELVLNNLKDYLNGQFVLTAGNHWRSPGIPTTPLALLTIDRNLAVVCETIGAYVLLSSPGYFSINPDAVYSTNKTLQECHNAFNSVPIFIAKEGDVSDEESKLYISTTKINKLDDIIDLQKWISQSTGHSPQTVTIEEDINRGNSVLQIVINYDASKIVTASVRIVQHKAITGKRRVYAENLLDAYENLEVTLKKNLKKIVDDDKRFFICYYPPDLSSGVDGNFRLKHLECGTLKEVLSESIDGIMYKPVQGDIYAVAANADAAADAVAVAAANAAAATIPYDPTEEFFKNIRENKTYWDGNSEDWKSKVRKLRLEMKRDFDSNTKLDNCRKAFLNYLPFDMLYPSKSDELNGEINSLCNLSDGQVPADKLALPSAAQAYFKDAFNHFKTTTSYLNLADLIKTECQVSLTEGSFAKCLNDLFISPQNVLQLNGDILTLDQLIECMDLLTTQKATPDTIRRIAAHPSSSLSSPTKPESYDAMKDNFTRLLHEMSTNFRNKHNATMLTTFKRHNDIYTELKLELETLHGILFTQYEDVKNLMLLYSSIPNDQYTFYTHTKGVYKHLIKTKGFDVLEKLIKMLIKVKRRYFQLLAIIERDDSGTFDLLIQNLKKELNGLDDNDPVPVTAAASIQGDAPMQEVESHIAHAASGNQGNISSTYVQAASEEADLNPNSNTYPNTHLEPEVISEIDEAKKEMLKSYDPEKDPMSSSDQTDQLEANLQSDIANAKKEKERCEVFMKINEELDKLYTKYLNSAYSIAAICLKGQQRAVNKSNKAPIFASLNNFKKQVLNLFCNHPFSNIVKFHTEFNLLLELENLVFILYKKVQALQSDGVIEVNPGITASGGGNMGYKYKKNKKKRKLYMKGGFISDVSFDNLKYSVEKRISLLNEYIVDNLYEYDIANQNTGGPQGTLLSVPADSSMATADSGKVDYSSSRKAPPVSKNFLEIIGAPKPPGPAKSGKIPGAMDLDSSPDPLKLPKKTLGNPGARAKARDDKKMSDAEIKATSSESKTKIKKNVKNKEDSPSNTPPPKNLMEVIDSGSGSGSGASKSAFGAPGAQAKATGVALDPGKKMNIEGEDSPSNTPPPKNLMEKIDSGSGSGLDASKLPSGAPGSQDKVDDMDEDTESIGSHRSLQSLQSLQATLRMSRSPSPGPSRTPSRTPSHTPSEPGDGASGVRSRIQPARAVTAYRRSSTTMGTGTSTGDGPNRVRSQIQPARVVTAHPRSSTTMGTDDDSSQWTLVSRKRKVANMSSKSGESKSGESRSGELSAAAGVVRSRRGGGLKTKFKPKPKAVKETKPKTTKETKPKTTKEIKPKTTKETKPKEAKETKPKTAKETKPKIAKETKPIASKTTKETKPKIAKEIKPIALKTTKETKPKTTKETKPKTTKETKPKTTKETKPKTTKEAKPKTTKETKPKTTKETKPKAAKTTKETKPKVEAKAKPEPKAKAVKETKPKAVKETKPKAVKETKPKAAKPEPKAKPKKNLLLKFKF